jgi:hypothetical protein
MGREEKVTVRYKLFICMDQTTFVGQSESLMIRGCGGAGGGSGGRYGERKRKRERERERERERGGGEVALQDTCCNLASGFSTYYQSVNTTPTDPHDLQPDLLLGSMRPFP